MTKLVNLNIGCRLEVLDDDGNKHAYEWSAICPSNEANEPAVIVAKLCALINDNFNTTLFVDWQDVRTAHVQIAKPSKLKTIRPTSHKSFNRRVKKNLNALGYKD